MTSDPAFARAIIILGILGFAAVGAGVYAALLSWREGRETPGKPMRPRLTDDEVRRLYPLLAERMGRGIKR
jgi:hypothetical protein